MNIKTGKFTKRQIEWAYVNLQRVGGQQLNGQLAFILGGLLKALEPHHAEIAAKVEQLNEPYLEAQARLWAKLSEQDKKLWEIKQYPMPQPIRLEASKIKAEVDAFLDEGEVVVVYPVLNNEFFKGERLDLNLANALLPFV